MKRQSDTELTSDNWQSPTVFDGENRVEAQNPKDLSAGNENCRRVKKPVSRLGNEHPALGIFGTAAPGNEQKPQPQNPFSNISFGSSSSTSGISFGSSASTTNTASTTNMTFPSYSFGSSTSPTLNTPANPKFSTFSFGQEEPTAKPEYTKVPHTFTFGSSATTSNGFSGFGSTQFSTDSSSKTKEQTPAFAAVPPPPPPKLFETSMSKTKDSEPALPKAPSMLSFKPVSFDIPAKDSETPKMQSLANVDSKNAPSMFSFKPVSADIHSTKEEKSAKTQPSVESGKVITAHSKVAKKQAGLNYSFLSHLKKSGILDLLDNSKSISIEQKTLDLSSSCLKYIEFAKKILEEKTEKQEPNGALTKDINEQKPTFSFGPTSTTITIPNIDEKKIAQSPKKDINPFSADKFPASSATFSFGSSTNSENVKTAFTSDSAMSDFGLKSFTGVQDQPKPFSFTFGQPSTTFGHANELPKENRDEIEDEESEQEEQEEITEEQKEKLKTGAGEEDETTKYDVRCKIYRMNTGEASGYSDLGINILKINSGDNGSRILARQENTGQITLNVRISAQTIAKIVGKSNKDVSVMMPELLDGKPGISRYSFRCKDENIAKDLEEAIMAQVPK